MLIGSAPQSDKLVFVDFAPAIVGRGHNPALQSECVKHQFVGLPGEPDANNDLQAAAIPKRDIPRQLQPRVNPIPAEIFIAFKQVLISRKEPV